MKRWVLNPWGDPLIRGALLVGVLLFGGAVLALRWASTTSGLIGIGLLLGALLLTRAVRRHWREYRAYVRAE